jgi:hypothetical protein
MIPSEGCTWAAKPESVKEYCQKLLKNVANIG